MSQQRLFGTDGIRGRAGEGWLAAPAVSALGRAIGTVLERERGSSPRMALLGHDGRRSGPELEAALARGLRAVGFEVTSAGLIPTPGLALLGRVRNYAVTVMVSASHNPAEDNGIKVFNADGEKLEDAVEDAIEAFARAHPDPVEADTGGAHSGTDANVASELEEAYLQHLLDAAGDLPLAGMHLVLDCANGAGSRVAPRVFGRLGAQVTTIAAEPDGDNINLECGATRPQKVQSEVRRVGADIGIALDGDGDRCILVDGDGEIVHGDGILTVIGRHAAQEGRLPGSSVVATVMSNRGLHRALREMNVDVVSVGVGDRQVVEGLRAGNLALGGEQSGHIIFGPDNHHIGDGTYTALRVLQVMRATGETLAKLASPYQPFPQVLLNVPVSTKPNLDDIPSVVEAVAAIEEELGQDGRVLLRYSGTESLARVMVEGPDETSIQRQATTIADLISEAIGNAAGA